MPSTPHSADRSRLPDWRSNRDLLATSCYALVAVPVLLYLGEALPPAARIPIAVPLLALVPGYALVTAVVPTWRSRAASTSTTAGDEGSGTFEGGFTALERFALAVVASLAVVPMVAVVANAVIGVELAPILWGLVAVTLVCSAVGVRRRQSAIPPRTLGEDQQSRAGSGTSWPSVPTDALTIGAAVIALLLLATSAGVAFTGEDAGVDSTEAFVVTEGEAGELQTVDPSGGVAADQSLQLGVEHGADEERSYTAVVAVEEGDGLSVTDRHVVTVGPDERGLQEIDASAAATDGDARLVIALYEGAAPGEIDREGALRVLEFPVTPAESG